MKRSISVDVDLAEFGTWDLAAALVYVAGDHDTAHRCVARVDRDKKHHIGWDNIEQEHTKELRALRGEVREALELIDRGRTEEGMHALRLFAAEEIRLTDWQRVKEGKHPFLKLAAA